MPRFSCQNLLCKCKILTLDSNKKDEQYIRFYMKREIIQAQIIDTLDAIIEQTQEIHQHKARIPQIEIDIVKKNIVDLYESYCLLDKLNQNSENSTFHISETSKLDTVQPKKTVNEKPKPTIEPKKDIQDKEIPKVDEKISEQIIATDTQPIIESIEEVVIEPESNTIADQNDLFVTEIEPITPIINSIETPVPAVEDKIQPKPEIREAPKTTINPNATTVADKFKSDRKTLNDSIENSDDKSIVSKMQKAPITDLVKAIGLNERFLFIKELFKNDGEQYSISIKILNEMDSLMHAFDYLDELKTKLDWDENSSACLKIYDLIRRKYQPKT